MLDLGKKFLTYDRSLDRLLRQSQTVKPPYGCSAPLSQSIQRAIFNIGEK